ncbi:putative oxidoreductase [Methanobrevibacter arboriphilus JCM 13429 = DSM 1125]|uniref:Putative oxidoreductase n=1 Tax=Methanobrevibacter arboriphilus JCM 13429 = DSM 1125 TaxID=1300164 RepID=A0A1V6N265_METAZ|nr:radical SAM protein [Methanobrevibacter arboriphilus]OQD58788.1 putative oxidoreductase [Methanobrevibacter arboriphilus JCM 13429 = DSM 1125]
MKILFLNLPYKFNISRASRWPEKTKAGTLYYPYWLAYGAGVCEKKGIETKLVDCITREYSIEDTLNEISSYGPDYIMAEITTPTCFYDFETINIIKKENPNLKIIIGGTHATILPEEVLNQCDGIDFVVRQEYDFTIPEIIFTLNNSGNIDDKGDISEIKGISYRSDTIHSNDEIIERGKIFHNPDRVPLDDLDELPFVSKVYQKFLNVDDYAYAFAQKPMIQIVSARGCPNKCNFCSYPSTMGGRLFRTRSTKDLVDEIEYILTEMPEIKEIFIEDDTFTVNNERIIDFCDEIIDRGLNPIWSCNTRVDLPFNVMEKMKVAGCRLLVTGYESGSQKVLDEIKKGITLQQSLDFAKNTKKLGIKVFGCFMIGLKGDNLDTINETFEFAKKVYPDMCFFQQAVPFPGTEFYEWVKDEGYLITEDYSKWLNDDGYLNCLVNYPYASAEEIEKIRDNLMSKYYFSFTYIFKTFLSNLDWIEFKRVFRGGYAYISFRLKKLVKKS